MKFALMLLRTALVAVLLASLPMGSAQAAAVEYLMVPSGAMGRDIPVAFMGGGPHAVYLLDAFNAGDPVSNWVTAGNAMNTLAGKGVAVAAPASGAFSMYTDWEQDGGRQWETFLSRELPDWLSANKGLAPGGHGIVGAAQGGSAALTMAEFHPDRFRYAGSMSGFLYPSATEVDGSITEGMTRYGGVDTRLMWGPSQFGRWKWHDPNVHVALLPNYNTRVWVFSPQSLTASDPAAVAGHPEEIYGTNALFYQHYKGVTEHSYNSTMAGGTTSNNGHFDFPVGGDHGWSTWGPQLGAMSGDLAATIR